MLISTTAYSVGPKPNPRDASVQEARQTGSEQGARSNVQGGLARAEQVKANLPGAVVQFSDMARRASEEFLAQLGLGGLAQAEEDGEAPLARMSPGETDPQRAAEGLVEGRSGPGELDPKEEKLLRELAARDRQVRAHEQAHAVAAGPYVVSGPQYEYQRGPDGKPYAVGGSVRLDTSPVPGDPEATVRKMTTLYRAALAPVDPSDTDRQIATKVSAEKARAQQEVTTERIEKIGEQLEQIRDRGLEEMSGSAEEEGISIVSEASSVVEPSLVGVQSAQERPVEPIATSQGSSGRSPVGENDKMASQLSAFAVELLQMPAEIFSSSSMGYGFATSRYLEVAGW